MATWYGTARSNWFRVKDEDAFRKDMKEIARVDVAHRDPEAATGADTREGQARPQARAFAIFDPYGEGWPSPTREVFDEQGDLVGEEEVDFFDLVASHLEDGEVAIFQEVGAEKQRYVTGFALAIDSHGRTLTVDIDDIYEKIERAGWPTPTRASR